ncbi:MAG: ATP-dependent DNA helicase [Tissierellia bacterium]|nr:ATP-dependent DNA helicase [Tissierellia bacterium]
MEVIRLSVRNLIEFVMRSGDIDTSYISQNRAILGIKAHQKLQKEYIGDYTSEYILRNESIIDDMLFVVEGRADGLIKEGDHIIIDEIKSTTRKLENLEDDNLLHWAQVKSYAYFYAHNENLEKIDAQLSYYNIEDGQTKRFRKSFTKNELKDFYEDLLYSYLDFSKKLIEWRNERNQSIMRLDFPFSNYRKGQREMAVAVYNSILKSETLFVEAPTGIGKTMSSLYPSIKAIGENLIDKIFYLTARSTTKAACSGAVDMLITNGLNIKSVTFTAKEKSCINEEVKCNPKDCKYAKGHFDRVNDAILDILDNEMLIDFECIEKYSLKHRICPFEFQLDLGIYSDIVICDYNYAFDPRVYLRRFFDNPSDDFLFLVDEAHNLIDRGRNMFSQELRAVDLINILEQFTGKYLNIRKAASNLLSKMELYRPLMGDRGEYLLIEAPEEIYAGIKSLTSKLDRYLSDEKEAKGYEIVLNTYFELLSYMRIADLYDLGFRTIFTLDDSDQIVIKLLCIDTSSLFKEALERARSCIYFSATLTPMDFYMRLLGGDENSFRYHLNSPFDEDNLFIAAIANISTRYNDRKASVSHINNAIREFISQRKGNYLVFFPSYAYMEMVYKEFSNDNPYLDIIAQDRGMSEKQRDEFLAEFNYDEGKIGFVVLGGVFSEGIDLVGDRLIGSIVVSVGLPGLSFERNTIRDYFNQNMGKGFEYSYMYPGMNKILQAAGRVIRTEKDRGAVLLIDDRFTEKQYRKLMPKHWKNIVNYYDIDILKERLNEFWRDDRDKIF